MNSIEWKATIQKIIAFIRSWDFVLISIVGSVTLFISFIFLLQHHVNAILPKTSYSLGVEKIDSECIRVTSYYTDSVNLNTKIDLINLRTQKSIDSLQNRIDDFKEKNTLDSGVFKIQIDKQKIKKAKEIKETNDNALTLERVTCYGLRVVTFNSNPKLLLWIVTFALMVGVSFTLLLNILDKIFKVILEYELKAIHWIVNSIIAIAFLTILLMTNLNGGSNKTFLPPFDIINDLEALFNQGVFRWIYVGEILAFVTASIAMYGTLLLNSRLKRLKAPLIDSELFLDLKGDLETFLSAFSILIVFSVLTISFLNQALIIHYTNIEKLQVIRSEFIYTYGFIFSSLLALIYVPINQKLYSLASPVILKENAGNEKNSFFNNFKSLISILGPLLGSGVAEIMKSLE